MDDQYFVFATAGIILVYFLVNVVVRKFDPFAPVWLFLVGYVQVYIIQAVSYREWALRVRGQELGGGGQFPRPVGVGVVPDRVPSRDRPRDCPCPTPASSRMVDAPGLPWLSPSHSLGTCSALAL